MILYSIMLDGFVSQHRSGFFAASNIGQSSRHLLITRNSVLFTFISILLMGHLLYFVIHSGKLVIEVLRCARSISRGKVVFDSDELFLVLVVLLNSVQVNSLTS